MKKLYAFVLIIFCALLLSGSVILKNTIKINDSTNNILISNENNNDLEKQKDPFYGDPFIKNEDNEG